MSEKILFLTGKLAQNSLANVLSGMTPPFEYEVMQIGITVAALMTPHLILNRVKEIGDADKIIVPGLCQGDLEPLQEKYGVPVFRGPEDLKDLPQYFGKQAKMADLSRYDTLIFAEIVDAPHLTIDNILLRAQAYQDQGANVIDLGCLPNTPFPHLPDAIDALQQSGFKVSVDSMNPEELLHAGKSGANYLLSLHEETLWIADEVESIPVIIPSRPGDLDSLDRSICYLQAKNKQFIADPILDPIPFGFTEAIVRYHTLRERYPSLSMMMGVGNLTELMDADTSGVNALLFGMISELRIEYVLTTSVSTHAVNAIREADLARRLMFYAREEKTLPKNLTSGLLGLHDRKPFPYSIQEIEAIASQIKDPSFRIQVSEEGIQVYNRDGHWSGRDPYEIYPHLKVDDDASHAFYLGVELAKAQIAWQLKKRFTQDELLSWGVSTSGQDDLPKRAHREEAIRKKLKS
jgi:dihydropteroate synthase-like protein